jgi:hypothetical protein
LTFAELGFELASGVWKKELARVEPVLGSGGREYRWQVPGEVRIVGTAVMPEREGVNLAVETENFLHAAVAVGGDDEVIAGEGGRCVVNTNKDVVVELALLMVFEQVILTPVLTNLLEEAAQKSLVG